MAKSSTSYKKGEGGRPKGVKNKTTRDIKEAYKHLIENNLENITDWLKRVALKDPDKAIKLLIDLSEYVIPKQQRTTVDLEAEGEKINIPLIQWVKTENDKDK